MTRDKPVSIIKSDISDNSGLGPKQQIKKLSKVAIVVTLSFLLVGSTIQGTILQFWIQSFPPHVGGPYFIVCWASLLFTIFFGILYAIELVKKPRTIDIREYIVNYTLQGLFNSLNGICIVFSAPISRTPPILFTVLINLGIVFGMIFTKFLIKEKRSINYLKLQVFLSLSFLAASVGLTVIGDYVSKKGTQTQFSLMSVFWIFITTLGSAFGALYNVLQQRYLKQTNPKLDTEQERKVNLFKTCFWTSFLQLMFMFIFFWVDIIPKFGFSTNINAFGLNFKNEMSCFFFGQGCGYKNFLYGVTFAIGYVLTLGSTMVLNKQSANFSIYAMALQSPLAMLVFVITGLGTVGVPLWSIIPPLFFIAIGIFIWKRWEIKEAQQLEPQEQRSSLYESINTRN